MSDYSDRIYDHPREWIKRSFQRGKSYLDIVGKTDDWLNLRVDEDGWPDNPGSYWQGLVDEVWKWRMNKIEVVERTKRSTLVDKSEVNDLDVPVGDDSCWQLYRESIRHYDNIDTIETECLNVLNNLSSDTSERDPVKGLVIGYVQSGKTANMAGLISMAADSGWNVFIVLSGTIDSLRKQNQNRLYRDLSHGGCRFHWTTLEHVNPDNPDQHPSKYDFRNTSPDRFLAVCLKNKTRLRNLLRWLNADQAKKKQMRILLIDDEADQASINTARPGAKRKVINDLIIRMVKGLDEEGNPAGPYAAMNYVSYTATPYANFLSEGSPESLYPRSFVTLLTPSDNYIGPVEIFGAPNRDEDGLGVIGYPGDTDSEYGIIDVSEDTDYVMGSFCDGEISEMPKSLRDAVCWFLCSAAVMRSGGYRKPVSMLIHTSQVTGDHKLVAKSVGDYLQSDISVILADCRQVYDRKTSQLPKEFFLERCRHYGRNPSQIEDYPDFDSIADTVAEYLKNELQHIGLDKQKKRKYGNGIHLCIDNCKNDILDEIVDPSDDEGLIPRLVYPDEKELEDLEPAPAFIVIGGNTLSRGLTIEGLVSTYFARKVSQGDTLMQMGRWFGYRIGYELLPRMWMSANSYKSFEKLVEVDESLREFIRENYDTYTPEEFPALVKNFPKTGYLTKMTAPSKSRGAVYTGYNFEGTIIESSSLNVETDALENNLSVASEFIGSLGSPRTSDVATALVWEGVDREAVFDGLLSRFAFSDKSKNFNEIEEMRKWVSSKCSHDWNVILAGVSDPALGSWDVCDGIRINKVGRSAVRVECDPETDLPKSANIKSLSSPIDRFAELRPDALDPDQKECYESNRSRPDTRWRDIRNGCGLEGIPALIIYCISKDSPASDGRIAIKTERDVVALAVIMPGRKGRKASADYLQIPASEVRGE